jgi:hypothetical protein
MALQRERKKERERPRGSRKEGLFNGLLTAF